jgi:hypothetical protein
MKCGEFIAQQVLYSEEALCSMKLTNLHFFFFSKRSSQRLLFVHQSECSLYFKKSSDFEVEYYYHLHPKFTYIWPDNYLNLRRKMYLMHFIVYPVLNNRMFPKAPYFALYHIQQDVSKTENFISMILFVVSQFAVFDNKVLVHTPL